MKVSVRDIPPEVLSQEDTEDIVRLKRGGYTVIWPELRGGRLGLEIDGTKDNNKLALRLLKEIFGLLVLQEAKK